MKPLLTLSLLSLCALVACTQTDTPDPDLNSETHWMVRCQDGQVCGDGGQCICGVCTLPCDGDAQCADAGPLTVCAPADDAALAQLCDGQPPQQGGVCLAPCGQDEACGDVRGGLQCQEDRCLPGPASCSDNAACDGGDFCEIEQLGACLDPNAPGVCAPRPEACIEIFSPVCGCDGNTYDNDCFAASAGVNTAAIGPCEDGPESCEANADCDRDDYCARAPGACGGDDAGTCGQRPEACIQVFEPVCGCDGNTYGNACSAASNGINVDYNGECAPNQVECGGIQGIECEEGFYCHLEPEDQCGGADQEGQCRQRPEACIEIFSPVCGCDGNTYDNDCFAASAGVNVLGLGECEAACSANTDCGDDAFCRTPAGACGGDPNTFGTCETIPEGCDLVFSPVCGCDGNTYGNECEANSQRQSIAATGECE